ncbi:hypothetical protein [Paraburkholderia sp.]|jgi:hypothetical protein|uniref:hypothetical protein n=1 Tax=Paraburkholderia sp. TaxID=1926495 RepID=UPI002F3FE7F3
MTDEIAPSQMVEYEGFEIHVAGVLRDTPSDGGAQTAADECYTFVGYVCHPGANPAIPGHAVRFHAAGDEGFGSEKEAFQEGLHVGRSIVEGTHADLTVLPLVTGGV